MNCLPNGFLKGDGPRLSTVRSPASRRSAASDEPRFPVVAHAVDGPVAVAGDQPALLNVAVERAISPRAEAAIGRRKAAAQK